MDVVYCIKTKVKHGGRKHADISQVLSLNSSFVPSYLISILKALLCAFHLITTNQIFLSKAKV